MLIAVCHLMIVPRIEHPLQRPHVYFYHALYFPRRLWTLHSHGRANMNRLTLQSQDRFWGHSHGQDKISE